MKRPIERRSLTPQVSDNKIVVRIPFNSVSEDLGGFRETIAPGAFSRSLGDKHEILAVWNHNLDMPMGRRSNGSLDLDEDDEGLCATIMGDDTSWCEDARASVRSGIVKGASFAFVAQADRWERAGGQWMRTLEDCDLLEISPTPSPAYPDTSASAT